MYQEENRKQRFITMGEIMLRLTPPDCEKIRTADCFEARYGGSEANVALSLANLGIDSSYFTVVPDNSLGKSAIRMMKSNDVDCTPVIFSTSEETPTHRLGTYYLETGYGIRPSKVIYDRKHSAFDEYDFTKVDLEKLLDGYTWLHLSGITPALGERCRKMIMDCLKIAKKNGITVSFDGNFRSTLWSFETARDVLSRYLPYVDVLIGIEPINVYNADGTDVKDGLTMDPSFEDMDRVFKAIDEQYHMKAIARTVRYVHSGSNNSLKAFYYADGKTYESKTLNFEIVDRVGGGDAFSSGLIYALMQNDWKHEDIVNFAVASSVMKHAIRGDTNITSVDQIKRLMNNASFDVQR